MRVLVMNIVIFSALFIMLSYPTLKSEYGMSNTGYFLFALAVAGLVFGISYLLKGNKSSSRSRSRKKERKKDLSHRKPITKKDIKKHLDDL